MRFAKCDLRHVHFQKSKNHGSVYGPRHLLSSVRPYTEILTPPPMYSMYRDDTADLNICMILQHMYHCDTVYDYHTALSYMCTIMLHSVPIAYSVAVTYKQNQTLYHYSTVYDSGV